MNIYYDPNVDALDVVFKKGDVSETREISTGVFLDVDKKGDPLSLEILDARRRLPADSFGWLSFNVANAAKFSATP